MNMIRRLQKVPIILLSLSFGACAWWMAGRGVQFLKRDLKISHALHIEQDVDCTDCHDGIDTATDLKTSYLPQEETCMDCHEREDECAACHDNPKTYRKHPVQQSDIYFSHEAHLKRTEGKCENCHKDVLEAVQLPVPRPTMDTCMNCHNHQEDYDGARCLGCHPTLRDKPLRAIGKYTHSGDWLRRHGIVAQAGTETCVQCHTQSTCTDCHTKLGPGAALRMAPELGSQQSQLHQQDFARSHSIEARSGVQLCSRCHEEGYCVRCHEARGVAASNGGALPHPPGFVLPGGDFHGTEVRRAPQTCAACHQGTDCAQCHSEGGIGGNPHPLNFWQGDPRRKNLSRAQCRVCHTGAQ